MDHCGLDAGSTNSFICPLILKKQYMEQNFNRLSGDYVSPNVEIIEFECTNAILDASNGTGTGEGGFVIPEF